MNSPDNSNTNNELSESQAAYQRAEEERLLRAIRRTDTEKFHDFTRMLRINVMLKNAKITNRTSD
jgi:hypothetical protein